MKRHQTLLALVLMLCAVLACKNLRDFSPKQNLFEDSSMEKAAAAFKEKVGGPIKVVRLEITPEVARLRVRDPLKPENVDEYRYSKGVCTGPTPVQLNSIERLMAMDRWLFSLDEVNFAATPNLINDALKRVNLEGGKVTEITITRHIADSPTDPPDTTVVRWELEIQGTRERASATANAKGEIISVDLSGTSRARQQNYLDTATLQTAVNDIKKAFGGRVTLVEFHVSSSYFSFKAVTPNSDDVAVYNYDLNGVTKDTIASMTMSNTGPQGEPLKDLYFQIDEINFAAVEAVKQTAVAKASLSQPYVDSMNIEREIDIITKASKLQWAVFVKGRKFNETEIAWFDARGNYIPPRKKPT